jgi:hypothetical protein
LRQTVVSLPIERIKAFLSLLVAFFCTVSVRATVVVCKALHDCAIDGSAPDNSNGGGPAFFCGGDGNGMPHRALILFDLSGIPAGATITNVQMTLSLSNVAGGGGGGGGMEPSSATISLYALSRNWGEGTNESTAAGIDTTGHGLMANPGDCTWDAAVFGTTNWSTHGGDYVSTASVTFFLNNNTVGNSFTWPSTAQTVADVQGWVNNPATDFGWLLYNVNETSQRTLYGFFSREYHTFAWAPSNAAQFEPSLQVTYTPAIVPIPAWVSWGTFVGFVLVARLALRNSRREAAR